MKMKFTKQEKSWISYDWANSVYATIMLAAIFPIYFTSVGGEGGDFWWGIGTSIATGIAAIISPILGAFADYNGMKKKIFATILFTGVFFTGFCAFVDAWQLMLVGYVISHMGFTLGNMVYDSFLVDCTTNERMDKVSAWGFSMGYIGGSTIPFLIAIALNLFGSSLGIDATTSAKISILIAVVWWGLFSIPILKNVKQMHGITKRPKHMVRETFRSLIGSIRNMIKDRRILFFLLAYFFYIDGVNTVINMSTAYGATLNLDTTSMILALLVTQLVAFPCAILFGRLAGKYGTIKLLTVAISIYFVICALGFIMGFGIEEGFLTIAQATLIFWILAFMVGLVQGGIQALSRSHFGKLVPKDKSGEYFGVFDIFGKFAAIMGPAIYAFVRGTTGRSSFAILAIVILFFLGGIFILIGRKYTDPKDAK